MSARLATRALVMLAATLSACALIDAGRSSSGNPNLTCVDDPNGCICSLDTGGSAALACSPDTHPKAICCQDARTDQCACAVPACFLDTSGHCLCGVFADPASFQLTPAPNNACPASGSDVVCCESHGSDYPSCSCGPECSATETSVGPACLPVAVTNCGALEQVDRCK